MTNLQKMFSKEKMLIPFITGGDPEIAFTEQLILGFKKGGFNLVGVGIPFSDPVAGGQIIQDADFRALSGGVTTDKIFEMLKSVQQQIDISIILVSYANPIFVYGPDKFMQNCREAKVEGIIVPDLPFEEKKEFLPFCREYRLALISTIAPTSKNRIEMITEEAEGFIHCMPSISLMDQPEKMLDELKNTVEMIKKVKDIPCVVDFNPVNAEQRRLIMEQFDGMLISSRVVEIIGKRGQGSLPYVLDYLK
ncbi:MAG: tryptophan synthase subunit alpha [Bacillota bacterium]